jgi:hypothetical protein
MTQSESGAANEQRTGSGRRPRRFRVTLRVLMALPVLLTLGFFVADRICSEDWTQTGTELVEFRVVEESTDRPLAGASVELTGGPVPQARSTGPDGTVAFDVPYRFQGSVTLLRQTRTGGYPWSARVSARGYAAATTRLDDHRPGAGDDFLPEQPIAIRLRPLPSH